MIVKMLVPVVACAVLIAWATEQSTSSRVAELLEENQQAAEQSSSSRVAEFIEENQKAEADDGPAPDVMPALPELSGLQALDEETRAVALDAIREYYRYRLSGYEHRRRVFEWQLQSSKIIFWVVILMVSAGIYFSGVQFHAALRAMRAAARPHVEGEEPGRTALETSLEASTGGIKVSSPVLGVIILVISFLFFYMYLVHVYPISEIM